jgi:hypothetical protein
LLAVVVADLLYATPAVVVLLRVTLATMVLVMMKVNPHE